MGSYTRYRDEELKKNPHLKAEYDALENPDEYTLYCIVGD